MKLNEHIIGQPKQMYNGKIIKVYREQVKTPKGDIVQRDIVHHARDVVALAINNQNQLILEKQWREPVKGITIEVPAGKIDSRDHHSPRHAMIRELNEEVRVHPNNLQHLYGGYTSTGITDEYMDFYLATDLSTVQTKLPRDKGEYIHLFSVSLQEALGLVEIGKIKDIKTILAIEHWARLLLAKHYRRGRRENLMIPIVLLRKAIDVFQTSYQHIIQCTIQNKYKGTDLFTKICAYPVMTSSAFNDLKLFHIIPRQYIRQSCQFINNLAEPKNAIMWHQNKKAQRTYIRLINTLRQYQKHYIRLIKPFQNS